MTRGRPTWHGVRRHRRRRLTDQSSMAPPNLQPRRRRTDRCSGCWALQDQTPGLSSQDPLRHLGVQRSEADDPQDSQRPKATTETAAEELAHPRESRERAFRSNETGWTRPGPRRSSLAGSLGPRSDGGKPACATPADIPNIILVRRRPARTLHHGIYRVKLVPRKFLTNSICAKPLGRSTTTDCRAGPDAESPGLCRSVHAGAGNRINIQWQKHGRLSAVALRGDVTFLSRLFVCMAGTGRILSLAQGRRESAHAWQSGSN